MKLPLVHRFCPANPAKPAWAVRLALAGMAFILTGATLVLGVAFVPLLQREQLLCASVTLVIAGIVMCSIASPVEHRPGDARSAPRDRR
jgi:hypothetical protein